MIILTMFAVLLLLLSINVPIAIGLAVTTIIAMVLKTGTSFLIDTAIVMFDGSMKFPLIAIPLFIRINNGIAINGNFIDPSNITIAVSIKKLVPVFSTIAIIVVTASPIAIGTFIDKRSRRTANIVRIIIKYLLFALHLLFEEPNFYNLLEFLRFQIK